MHERPFQKVGGIEKAFGVRNKDVVRDFINRELSVIQENPQRSEFALAQDLLTPTDDTIRRTREGIVLVSFLRRSKNPEDPKDTLVERWSAFDDPINQDSAFDAERALREYVAGSYQPGGQQYENRQTAFRHANVILRRLQSGSVNDFQRERLVASTREAMSGYFRSTIPERLKTAEKFIRSLEKDSKGRQNPSAGRVIVTSERIPVIKDRFIDDIIVVKNLHRASIIEVESSFEEAIISQALMLAERVASISSDRNFRTAADNDFFTNLHYLLSPRNIKMKPYANIAAKLRFMLFAKIDVDGLRNDDISMGLARYVGNEAYNFAKKYPFYSTLKVAGEKKDRLKQFTIVGREGLEKIHELRVNPPKKDIDQKKKTKDEEFWERAGS